MNWLKKRAIYIYWYWRVRLHSRHMNKAILFTLQHGSARQIREICAATRHVAVELKSPELLAAINRTDDAVEEIVLRRTPSWRWWRRKA